MPAPLHALSVKPRVLLAAERTLGRAPQEMPHNNPGWDIRSVAPDGQVLRIEVKGRISGADDFTITHNEVLTAKNLDLADKWMAGQLTLTDLADYSAQVGARVASDPWKLLQAISKPKGGGS